MFAKTLATPLIALSLLAAPAWAQTVTTTTETVTTEETASILPTDTVSGEDEVMAASGELLGLLASVVPVEGGAAQYIIQVDPALSAGTAKNVTLEAGSFSMVDGQIVLNVTLEEFMALVAEQNPT